METASILFNTPLKLESGYHAILAWTLIPENAHSNPYVTLSANVDLFASIRFKLYKNVAFMCCI